MRNTRRNINGWFDTIHKPSSPYLETFQDMPADQDDWTCSDFYVYHVRNKKLVGGQKANEYFILDIGNLNSFATAGSCKYDCEFVQYMYDNNIPYDSIYSDVFCAVSNLSSGVYNITDSAKGITKAFIPIAVVALGLFGYSYAKKNKLV